MRLEEKGVELEQRLRVTDDVEAVDDRLVEEWFGLVNQRNLLLRQESDLVYQVKDLELIEQHDELEVEIRRRLALEDAGKTEMERLEEEAMISELVDLVERRDKLLWALHFEKTLAEAEDKDVETAASVQGFSLKPLRKTTSAVY